MAYEIGEIKLSQQIFYYLLEHHELKEEEEWRLYRAYTEEESIQNLVKSQAEEASSSIERYGNVIYLIPKEENVFLGFYGLGAGVFTGCLAAALAEVVNMMPVLSERVSLKKGMTGIMTVFALGKLVGSLFGLL